MYSFIKASPYKDVYVSLKLLWCFVSVCLLICVCLAKSSTNNIYVYTLRCMCIVVLTLKIDKRLTLTLQSHSTSPICTNNMLHNFKDVRSCFLRTFSDRSSISQILHHISFLLVNLSFTMPIKLYSNKKLRLNSI